MQYWKRRLPIGERLRIPSPGFSCLPLTNAGNDNTTKRNHYWFLSINCITLLILTLLCLLCSILLIAILPLHCCPVHSTLEHRSVLLNPPQFGLVNSLNYILSCFSSYLPYKRAQIALKRCRRHSCRVCIHFLPDLRVSACVFYFLNFQR